MAGQVLATCVLGLAAPLAVLVGLHVNGRDISELIYLAALAATLLDILLLFLVGLDELRFRQPPRMPWTDYPPLNAVVLSHPGDDPATLEETADALLHAPYLAPAEVLAVCSSREQLRTVQSLAADHGDRLRCIDGQGMTRDEQMRLVAEQITGQMVAVFDAGQIPRHDVFTHAWLWLSHGVDALQGAAQLSGGKSKLAARLWAVEQCIPDAPPCPISAPWDDASWCTGNTYLRAGLLRRLAAGTGRIAYSWARDRTLAAYQHGPERLSSLWSGRAMQEAALTRLPGARVWKRSGFSRLTRGWGLSLLYDFIWQPAYVWLSLLVPAVIGFRVWLHGSVHSVDWALPLIGLALLYALGANLIRAAFAFGLAPPDLRRRKRWFVQYAICSVLFYAGIVHTIARTAQLRAIFGRSPRRHTEPVAITLPPEQTLSPLPTSLTEAAGIVPVSDAQTMESNGQMPDVDGTELSKPIPAEETADQPSGAVPLPFFLDREPAQGRRAVPAEEPETITLPVLTPSVMPTEKPSSRRDMEAEFGAEDQLEHIRRLADELRDQLERCALEIGRLRAREEQLEDELARTGTSAGDLKPIVNDSVRDADLDAIRAAMRDLVAHPDNIVVLASVSQQAQILAAVADAYNQVQQALTSGRSDR